MHKDIDFDSRLLDEPSARLAKPVCLSDIIGHCSDFTIRTTGEEDEIERQEETDISRVFSIEELEPFCLPEVLEAASDDENDDSTNYDDIAKSFPVFRKRMFNLTEDGKVMKLMEHESHDEKVPSEGNVVVYYHYAAYVEFTENPFDCSRLRQKRPDSKTLGTNEVIPGLEIALRSMRRGEKAKFLVHPDLAFGSAGIPPRIPPQSTILFSVELVDICADMKEEYVQTRDMKFDDCLELARKFRASGSSAKKRDKNVNSAISHFKKGLKILIEACFDNDEDEKSRRKEMLHLYSNLAVCYLEKNRPKMVCNMFNDARADCGPDGERHPKLLYCSGKALRMLGSYDESLRRLRKALRFQPQDEFILKELDATDAARKQYLAGEKSACKRMFGFMNLNDAKTTDEDDEALLQTISAGFRRTITETLDYMDEHERKSETLNAACYTLMEKQFIRNLCAKRNFLYKMPTENTIIIIKKSVPN